MSCFTHTVPQRRSHRAVASHRQAVALRGASANVLPCVCSSPPPSHPHYTHRDDTGTITNTNTNTNKNTNTNSKQIPTNTQIWIIQRLHLFVHLRPSHRHYTPPDDTPHYNDCTATNMSCCPYLTMYLQCIVYLQCTYGCIHRIILEQIWDPPSTLCCS